MNEELDNIIGNDDLEAYSPKSLPSSDNQHKIDKIKRSPVMRETGNIVVNKGWYTFLSAFFLIILILFMVALTFLVWKGKFQSIVSNDVNMTTNVNATVDNHYDFNPSTNNQYSFTIPVNVTIVNRITNVVNST